MYKAFGIINSSSRNIWVEGLQDYRPIGAFSFLGRYRVIDFSISNMTNSGIDRIQVYINTKPRSLVEHLGTGRHYNINSKSGKLQLLFSQTDARSDIYNTDVQAYYENLEYIKRMQHPYVVIAPSYFVYSANYDELIEQHIKSGADITMLYHSVDNAKESFLNCTVVNLNRQKGVLSLEPNQGNTAKRNVSLATYVMKRELFIDLILKAKETSSMFTLKDIINDQCSAPEPLDVRGVAHKGFFAAINDFNAYFRANMDLIDYKNAQSLFMADWPIYTRTNNSSPTHYYETASIRNSVVSNGCIIEGTIENSVVGRGCVIHKGAVVKNSIILAGAEIGEDTIVENTVVDKRAKLLRVKEVISSPDNPGYIRRQDIL
ncbi:MAG: glucose-1-phosphate adenylyltransferase subunit GlgD [Blautia sp.]|nr:glucose-1-phosphate adenylyltransferase subunit GlgD [Blautia sp.]